MEPKVVVLEKDTSTNHVLDPWALPLLAQWPKVLQVLNGQIPAPAVTEVFITNHCDFHCPHCRFKAVHGTQDDHMSVAEFDSLLEELSTKGVSHLELSGGGEPLDHPQVDEIFGVIAKRGFRIGLITNGYKLVERPELITDLLPIADWIRFSVDAFSDPTYSIVHGRKPAQYARLREMIRSITGACRRLPAIGVKMLISTLNKDDALLAASAALDLGARYLQLKFLGAPLEHVLPGEQISDLSVALVGQLRTLNRDGLAVEFLPPYAGELTSEPCLMTYLHPIVDWDGTIYICPFFEHRKSTHSIGNIRVGGFFRWWNDPLHQQVFAGIDPNTCVPNCPMKRYNPVVKFIQLEAFHIPYP